MDVQLLAGLVYAVLKQYYFIRCKKIQIKSILYRFIHSQILNTRYLQLEMGEGVEACDIFLIGVSYVFQFVTNW